MPGVMPPGPASPAELRGLTLEDLRALSWVGGVDFLMLKWTASRSEVDQATRQAEAILRAVK